MKDTVVYIAEYNVKFVPTHTHIIQENLQRLQNISA